MKIEIIKGEQGSYMGRSVFQNNKRIANTEAAALLQKFPTDTAQVAQGIEVSVKRYFRFVITEATPEELTALETAKAKGGYFVKDANGQHLFICSNFSLNKGELRKNADGIIYAGCEEAERITTFCKQNNLSITKELIASGLM